MNRGIVQISFIGNVSLATEFQQNSFVACGLVEKVRNYVATLVGLSKFDLWAEEIEKSTSSHVCCVYKRLQN